MKLKNVIGKLNKNPIFYSILLIIILSFLIFGYTYWANPVRPGAFYGKGWYGGWADQGEYYKMAKNISNLDFSSTNYFAYPLGYPLLGGLLFKIIPQDPFLIPNVILYIVSFSFAYLITLKIIKNNIYALLTTILLFFASGITNHLTIPWTTNVTTTLSFVCLYILLNKFSFKRLALLSFLAGYSFFTRYADGLIVAPFVIAFFIKGFKSINKQYIKLFTSTILPGLIMILITLLFNYIIYKDIRGSYFLSIESQGFDPILTWPTKIIGMFLNPWVYQHDVYPLSVAVLQQSIVFILFPISLIIFLLKYLKEKKFSLTISILLSVLIWCILYIPFVAISPETLKYGSSRYIGSIIPVIFFAITYFINYISNANKKALLLLGTYTLIFLFSLILISLNKPIPLELTNAIIFSSENNDNSRKIIDNDVSSFWSTNIKRKNGDYLLLTLANINSPRGFIIDSSLPSEECLPNFVLTTSLDNVNWSSPKKYQFDTCTTSLTKYFYPIQTKYIKFKLIDVETSESKAWTVNNLIIFN